MVLGHGARARASLRRRLPKRRLRGARTAATRERGARWSRQQWPLPQRRALHGATDQQNDVRWV